MIDKINKYLEDKGIKEEIFRNTISLFVVRHTELFGNVISFDTLMSRLYTNLDFICLKDPNEKPKDSPYMLEQYIGFNENRIDLYFTQDNLKNPVLRENLIDILIHALVHSVYTIKENDLYETETHIFCSRNEIYGDYKVTSGDATYMEPIVNFIACCVQGKKNALYVAVTNSMIQLSKLINVNQLIHSAFYSDKEEFINCFDVFPLGAFEYFTDGIKYLAMGGNWFDRGKEIMDNFFLGKIPEKRESRFQEIHSQINSNIESLPRR